MNISKRRARLVELIQRMNDGHDISSRDMKTVLTGDEYDEFIQRWDAEKDKRTAEKPQSVKNYEKLLNRWHLASARVEQYRRKRNKIDSVMKKMNIDCDSHLERIQEYLQEHQGEAEFNLWLDRSIVTYGENEKFNPERPSNSLDTPPMVVTSRSHHNQSNGFMGQLSKRDIKKMVLTQALFHLDEPTVEMDINKVLKDFKQRHGGINQDRFKVIKV